MILRAILLTILGIAFIFTGMTSPEGLTVGDKAPEFSLADVDGQMISFDSYENAKGYVVIFTCNTCPYAKAYQKRIAKIQEKYAEHGYPVIAINTSDSKDDIIARAKEQNYPFSYLHDVTQEVSRAYGASKTPHAFLLKKDKTVAYIGAIDNNYKDADAADQKYLEDAIEALMENRAVEVTQTKAIGCSIKWKDI